MIITTDDIDITLSPDNDVDCYDLGRMAHLVRHVTHMVTSTDTPQPKLTEFIAEKDDFMTMIAKLLDRKNE